jgi:regulatory protein
MTQTDISRATDTALRLLAQRSLSEAELRQRLHRREFPDNAIEQAVTAMRGYRYLDDAKLAEGVRNAAERRGKGPRWIQSTLRRRGVDATLAERAAQVDVDSQTTQALTLLQSRFSGGLPDARTRQRAYRLLLSRGFSYESVASALRQHGPGVCEEEFDPIPEENL